MRTARNSGSLNPALAPRSGTLLKVLGVARISGHTQDEASLEDQEASYRRWIEAHYDGPYQLEMIATRGKGEQVDRAELGELDERISSGNVDLVICEDIGRIVRRMHAFLICESCEDAEVRLIAVNDCIDTFQENWRLNTLFANMRHEQYNRDTSERIKRTQRNRFLQGGTLRTPLFCYLKPPGAKHDTEMQKIPEMVPVVEGIISRLENDWSFSRVADWLNETKVPLGPGSRVAKWTGVQVRNVVFNPLLKGVRVRNRKVSIRINKTGRRKSVSAPPEALLERAAPHLAFVDAGRYDRLIAKLVSRGEQYSVPKRRGNDPRKGREKKRTRFPGQLVKCGICNRLMVFGGHGRKTHLMCSGARAHRCWNGTTFDADLACAKVSAAIFEMIEQIPEFDSLLREAIIEEATKLQSDVEARRHRLDAEISRYEKAQENMLAAIRINGPIGILTEDLKRLEQESVKLLTEREELDAAVPPSLELPSVSEIREAARQAFQGLASSSYEFSLAMRRLIKTFVVMPVRLIDGGNVELRAKITISLSPLLNAEHSFPAVAAYLTKEIQVDLFEPSQRAEFMHEVVTRRGQGQTEREVATALGLTITATQRAAKLHRLMLQLGLDQPYVDVTSPPADLKKMRRHLHSRYKFEPLPPDEAA